MFLFFANHIKLMISKLSSYVLLVHTISQFGTASFQNYGELWLLPFISKGCKLCITLFIFLCTPSFKYIKLFRKFFQKNMTTFSGRLDQYFSSSWWKKKLLKISEFSQCMCQIDIKQMEEIRYIIYSLLIKYFCHH